MQVYVVFEISGRGRGPFDGSRTLLQSIIIQFGCRAFALRISLLNIVFSGHLVAIDDHHGVGHVVHDVQLLCLWLL